MNLGLEGRCVFVSGSWRGTGAAIARVCAREGARVVVHGQEEGQADAVADEIRASGGDVRTTCGDLTRDAGAAAALAGLDTPIDALVANYGTAAGGGWTDGSSEEWLDMFERNVLSGVRLIRALLPGMRERGFGRIVLVGTVGSVRPRGQMPGYYASKAALPNMCASLARELAGTGITANTVSPGIIATAEVRETLQRRARREGWPDDWASISRLASTHVFRNSVGRICEPEEVGDLVAFLCSERAGYIHGANLRIDGGAADCV